MNSLKLVIFLTIPVICRAECVARFSETSVTVLTNERHSVELLISNCTTEKNLNISIKVQHRDNLLIFPEFIEIDNNTTEAKVLIELQAIKAGETNLYTNSSELGSKQAFITVQIYKNQAIEILSIIIGWAYFFAWSISFYPQAYENYKRRRYVYRASREERTKLQECIAVVGLNFDFVVVNITGYVLYSMFNLGLYYIPAIRAQYEERYPFSIVSVLPNDIVFGIHAFAITAYTGLQCLWYDRGDQSISWFGKWFHYISAGIMAVTAIMCFVGYMLWLDFLYICSYIKLSVTFCKYGPQAIMNYKRQSTEGWSITTVLLDIAGGICSVLQMFMNAYNYEKWAWILENPTKLWLGVFSLLFDFFFVFQHCCLYNKKHKNRRQDSSDAKTEMALSEKETLKISEDDKVKPENGNIIKD